MIYSGIVELKSGWFVRLPYPMNSIEMSHFRFDPITIAAVVIAGASVQAYGQYQQGKAAAAEGKAEQEILNYNAALKDREAQAQLERSREGARQFEEQGRRLMGEQNVGYARSGVLTTSGNPFLVLEETKKNLAEDRMRIIKEGYLAKSFSESEATGLRFQGSAAKAKGQNIKTASQYQAAGSILTGFGSAAYTYKTI